jgi:ABC-type multidrug transport system fused ATPase/permease subunit
VLDQGKVVQRGTHSNLWCEGGIYAELVHMGDA